MLIYRQIYQSMKLIKAYMQRITKDYILPAQRAHISILVTLKLGGSRNFLPRVGLPPAGLTSRHKVIH